MYILKLLLLFPLVSSVSTYSLLNYLEDVDEQIAARDLDSLLGLDRRAYRYARSNRNRVYTRSPSPPSSRRGSTPELHYDSKTMPETVDNKIKGELPTTLHPLPDGTEQDRSDSKGKQKEAGKSLDHAIPAKFLQGKEATEEGTNRIAPADTREQNKEGGKVGGSVRKAGDRGKDHVKAMIDGEPAGKVSGHSPPDTPSRSPSPPATPEQTGPTQSVLKAPRRSRTWSPSGSKSKRSSVECSRLFIRTALHEAYFDSIWDDF